MPQLDDRPGTFNNGVHRILGYRYNATVPYNGSVLGQDLKAWVLGTGNDFEGGRRVLDDIGLNTFIR